MTTPWWQTAVVYQIYPRSFLDTNGDGVGDLNGVTAKLDYLTDTLGVDAIWLSPFFPSPQHDFGYDVSNYVDVDPLFGTLEDFDLLLAEAHARNLKVIIDYVPNHSSNEHPWFLDARSSRDNPKRDCYVWSDPADGGGPPNNWLSVFGGSSWEWDEKTGQYYLHSFLKEQPDFNWRNPEVEAAMLDVLRFWLDRGVDGFRVDVARFIMKDPELRDNPPAQSEAARYMGPYDTQQHIHDQGHPDVHDAFRKMRFVLDEYEPERYSVGEIHIFDWDLWASYYGQNDELHQPFNFALLVAPWTAQGVRSVVDGLEGAVPHWAWPNYVLGNHDEQRMATRLGEAGSRLAAVLLLTLRGTPTLYYGDELGITQLEVPPDRQRDPWGRRVPGKGRDGCRTPMQWSPGPGSGFSDGEPWLPTSDDGHDVETQLGEPASHLNLYRSLLALRKDSAALRLGSYRPLDDVPADVFAYVREEGDERDSVAFNIAHEPRAVPLVEGGGVLLAADSADVGEGGLLTLGPKDAAVISLG